MENLKYFFITLFIAISNPVEKVTGWKILPSLKTDTVIKEEVKNREISSFTPTMSPIPTLTNKNISPILEPSPNPVISGSVDKNNNSDFKVIIIKPSSDKVYKADETAEIEVSATGNPDKIEIYVGSGMLVSTLNTPPYKIFLDLKKYSQGITANYKLPLGIKGYDKNGKSYYENIDINIVPSNVQTIPPLTAKKLVSFKTPYFLPNPSGTAPTSAGKFNFGVEYDEFVKSVSFNIAGSINGLKPNTEYSLSANSKVGKLSIQNFTTDNLGNGWINTIYSTNRIHYCDFYTLEVSRKDSTTVDMFGNELTDICPKG